MNEAVKNSSANAPLLERPDNLIKRTILIYSANYLPNIGGVEKYTHHLSTELEKMGHHVIIVTNNLFNLKNHEILDSGSEIFRLPCHSLIDGRLPLPAYSAEFRELKTRISKIPVDHVIVNTRFYPHSFLGVRQAESRKIKPIVIDHGSAHLTLGRPALDIMVGAYEHFATRLLRRHEADYYGVSKASVEWLEHFDIEGLGVISNSIDADAYISQASSRNFREEVEADGETFLVTFTGRLIPEKGIDRILEAASILIEERPTIRFAIAGSGPLKEKIIRKNPGNINLLGPLTSEDIAALLQQSDAFCLPTRSEGFSTSLLEAASCYLPSVITDVGGVAELIPSSEYGIVLGEASGREIADAIIRLSLDSKLCQELGGNIGKRVRTHYSWHNTAKCALEACRKGMR